MAKLAIMQHHNAFRVLRPSAPYPGLRPFEKHEWPVFFGREKMADEVINHLIRLHLVVVHGDSGCGKSSLIRAGVLTQLEQEHARSGISWRTCTMLPRDAPLWGLAQALAKLDDRADHTDHVRAIRRRLNLGADAPSALADMLRRGDDDHICILVDQFEELFSFAKRHGSEEARLFVEVLVSLQRNPPSGLYAILTMRSEFLGGCARYRGFAEAVNQTQYLVSRMERPALLRAIREPARLYNGEVTKPLSDRLMADAGDKQDELPLIQHGLRLLWRRKVRAGKGQQGLADSVEPLRFATGLAEGATPFRNETGPEEPLPSLRHDRGTEWRLDLEDYRSAGGDLAALLSGHADDVMAAAAPEPERERIVEHLFRTLTDINAEGNPVRRPQTLAQLQSVTAADEATLRTIVDAFRADGVSFLNPYGADQLEPDQQIDISHEALIRCWQKIADEKDGWLQREFWDGLIWKTLRVHAQKGETLSIAATEDRDAWLETLPSPAWSDRYDGGWDDVQHLMDRSRKARDGEVQRQRELDELKSRVAETRAQSAEQDRRAAEDVAAHQRKSTSLLIKLGSVILAFTCVLLGGEKLDHPIFDTFFRIRGPLSEQSDIVIVGIDDDSFQNLDLQWPWPRRLHAELLKSLSAARARVVVFNVLFDTQSKNPDDDHLFSKAIATHPNVILATTRTITETKRFTKTSWLDPVPTLMSADTPVGCIELLSDPDGVVRRAQLDFAGRPTLSYLAARRFVGKDHGKESADHDQAFTINFLGPPGTIPTVSYYQALKPSQFLSQNTFKNKLVFIGSTAEFSSDPNRPDHFLTPFSREGTGMSGVEILANVAYNLIQGSYIRQVPRLLAQVVGLLVAFLCGLLFFRLTPSWDSAIFSMVSAASLLVAYWQFTSTGYYVPIASFLVATGIFLLVSVFAHYYETYQSAKRNRLLLQQSEIRIREFLAAKPAGTDHGDLTGTAAPVRTIKVFISYKREVEDARYMAEILNFLSGLRKEGIEFWTYQELRRGDRWDTQIKQNLAESDIALVLVSQAYLDSDYCINTEISSFLERKVTIVPVMLSPCEWQRHAWLRERQFLPGRGETLTEHYQDAGTRQRMFLEILAELRRQADRLRGGEP